jgi:hypothetical protein
MNIPLDKAFHFLAGWALGATLAPISIWLALGAVVVAGAAKEWWDSKGHGTPEWMDFAATVLGGVAGVTTCRVLTLLWCSVDLF